MAAQAFPSENSSPRAIESDSIESLFQVAEDIYSGAEPRGVNAFQQLRELGIRTVISVDGARPDLASARASGIRSIHIPTGYGRWSRTNQLQLIAAAKFARESGPVLIHCHHGRHRGPTATALICMGLEDWNATRSLNWLGIAGTGTNYQGLFEMVAEFDPPSRAALGSVENDFPEKVEPSGIVETMTALDEFKGRIELLLSKVSTPDDSHLHRESVLLLETLREFKRGDDSARADDTFVQDLNSAIERAQRFEEIVSATGNSAEWTSVFRDLKTGCVNCHKTHRDGD